MMRVPVLEQKRRAVAAAEHALAEVQKQVDFPALRREEERLTVAIRNVKDVIRTADTAGSIEAAREQMRADEVELQKLVLRKQDAEGIVNRLSAKAQAAREELHAVERHIARLGGLGGRLRTGSGQLAGALQVQADIVEARKRDIVKAEEELRLRRNALAEAERVLEQVKTELRELTGE